MRYTGPSCRLCRREGEKLFLKGVRCETQKCPMLKRNFPPGQTKVLRRRPSEYARQLREKQKAKRIYGLAEQQFYNYYLKAVRNKKATGDGLLTMLESRLDNVVYRSGFADSLKQARQLVNHGHFLLKGRKVTIPSVQMKIGDEIQLKDKSKKMVYFQSLKNRREKSAVSWLDVDLSNLTVKVKEAPDLSFITIETRLIIELYSK